MGVYAPCGYRSHYRGWTVKHFHDRLRDRHGFAWSYTWTKTTLQRAGLVSKAPKRGVHRRRRPRKPCVGMMLHQDGSRHEWLAGQAACDLIVTMDDATSEIYSAFLVEEEGTASTFRALKQVFTDKGLPSSLYTDRGSHYFHTPEAGGKVDKSNPTQVGRALHQLGIEHIAAYSPQARGRSERAFGTLQNRLVKELSLAGITEIEAANRFIEESYLPDHNRRFATKPELEASAFVSSAPPDQVHEVLCLHTKRVVAHDNTVRHERRVLQIPASPVRHHYVKATVRVHEYPDGTLALFHGPRCLARYQADWTRGESHRIRDGCVSSPTGPSASAFLPHEARGEIMMTDNLHVVHACAAGLDVHKMQITASIRICVPGGGTPQVETRTFEALASGLSEMVAWLRERAVDAAVMEGTRSQFKPQPSQTQAPVTPATEPERRAGGGS